jgi:thioredoxin-dependent peroxiredoxin
VVYFYPRDNTPGCTRQGQGFRDLYPEFQQAGLRNRRRFARQAGQPREIRRQAGIPVSAAGRPRRKLCREFDVIKEKNMYGKKVMGIERSTFLFDADGKLVREWRKVRVPGHVEEVLEAVREPEMSRLPHPADQDYP